MLKECDNLTCRARNALTPGREEEKEEEEEEEEEEGKEELPGDMFLFFLAGTIKFSGGCGTGFGILLSCGGCAACRTWNMTPATSTSVTTPDRRHAERLAERLAGSVNWKSTNAITPPVSFRSFFISHRICKETKKTRIDGKVKQNKTEQN